MHRPIGYLVLVTALLFPCSVFAQATLTGTVRDDTGAVLPGVSVEASSSALIEKTKTAVTDGTGQYRIIDLRAGTYTVKFALPGFTPVTRENVVLSGSQTLAIPIELRVGNVQEEIRVTSETPVVDVQTAKREIVLDDDAIKALPAARAAGALLNATPGLTVDNNGIALSPTMTFFSAHGGPVGEGRMTVGGITVAAARSGGVSSYVYDTPNAQEVAILVSGGLGEADIGGPVMNLIPKSGGNRYTGDAFLNLAGEWSRGDNLTQELKDIGLTQTPGIIHAHDTSLSFGGPIKRDNLWFFGSYRTLDTQTAVEGITANANAFDASRWDWAGSPVNARLVQDRQMIIGRLTGQVGKHRLQFNSEYQHRCEGTPLKLDSKGCHNRGSDWIGLGNNNPAQSPEATNSAARGYFDWPFYLNQGQWTMPATDRLLLEGGVSFFRYNPAFGFPAPDGITDLIPVTEQVSATNPSTGLPYAPVANFTYRGMEQWGYSEGKTDNWRVAASYVTGAHSMKVGYQGDRMDLLDQFLTNESQLAYRFNRGVPNAVTYRLPDFGRRGITNLTGIFIQDQFTLNRLTFAGALRYDRATSYAPVEKNGTTRTSWANPNGPIGIEKTPGVDAYNDLSPRLSVAYDLFGTGKTALKFAWGRYLAFAANDAPYTSTNPAATIVSVVTNRGWTDNDSDKVVDCNLLNPALQNPSTGSVDTCAAATGNSANFGQIGAATRVNPEVLEGWGRRPHDYQTTFTVQHELLPRLSVEGSYIYRTFHSFFVTYDTTRDPVSSWETYTLTAPVDPRLPNGGGYPITTYVPTAAAAAIPAQQYQTLETDFGPERDSYFQGVDFTLNARLRGGLMASFGTSTGTRVIDQCETVTKYGTPDPRGCRDVTPYQTTVRGLASYTIPKIDVLVSTTVRSQPALELTAGWIVPNTTIQAALGHLPPGSTLAGNTTIQLTDDTNKLYVDNRRTQIDMRFAKIVRLGRTRTDIGVDLNNLLNTNYATSYVTTYSDAGGTWGNPTAIYPPRFVRLNFTVGF